MGIESDFIWFDGEMVPYDQANVHVLSHTLHYGLGVFEGIRAYEQPDGVAEFGGSENISSDLTIRSK